MVFSKRSQDNTTGWTYREEFNPNTSTWNESTFSSGWYNAAIANSHLLFGGKMYYRNPAGSWLDKGYFSSSSYITVPNNEIHLVYTTNPYGFILAYLKNGELQTLPVNYNGLGLDPYFAESLPVGGKTIVLRNNGSDGLFYATSLTLCRFIDDAITGLQLDRPVRQIEVFDGGKSSYTAFQYDGNTAVKDPTGINTYYNKVTVHPGVSLSVLEPTGPVSINFEKYGYTQNYFFNGLPSSQTSVPYTLQGAADRYKYLTASIYESRVYNADDKLVSSTKTSWAVNDYPIYNNYGYADSKYRGLPVSTISMLDSVQTTVNNSFNSIGQLSMVSSSNQNSLNQEDVITTTYTYGHQVYTGLADKNILAPVVCEKKIVSGTVTDVSVNTWKNWGNDFYGIYKTFSWTGAGNSDFDFSSYGSSVSDPPSASWKKASEVLSRDAYGNITSGADAEGIKAATVYSSAPGLPIMQVVNADADYTYANNFDLDGIGSYSSQSSYISSSYWIVNDGILKWIKTDMTGLVSPFKNLGSGDFIAELQMRIPVSSSNLNWIGFQFNKNTPDNSSGTTLILRPNGNVELQNAAGQILGSAQAASGSSSWHYFRIIRKSGTVDIYLNGKLLLSNINTGSIFGGYVGLLANNCLAEFDNVRIYPNGGIATATGYDKDFLRVRSVINDQGLMYGNLYDNLGRLVAKTRGNEGVQTFTYRSSVQNNNGEWNPNDPDLVLKTTIQDKSGIWEDFMTSGNTWSLIDRNNGTFISAGTSSIGGWGLTSYGQATNNLTDSYVLNLFQPLSGRVCVEMSLMHYGTATDWNLGIAMGGAAWDGSDGGTDLAVYSSFNGAKVWNTFSEGQWKPVANPFDANRWYRVKIIADLDKQKADYYIDGKLLLRDAPFRMSSANISKLSLFSYNLGAQNTWFIQNLLVYSNPVQSVEYYAADGKQIQVQTEEPGNQILVSETMYDEVGRETIVTKPTKVPARFGYRDGFISQVDQNKVYGEVSTYNPDDNNFPFSNAIYEASPLGRSLSSSLPGNDFNVSTVFPSSSIKNSPVVSYGNNSVFPEIGGNYLAKAYFVTKLTDADGIVSYKMKDKAGNTIREKSGSIVHSYEYDREGNLVKVYQPNYFTPPPVGLGQGTTLTLNQSNTTGEYTATGSISLTPGFSSSGSFHAYISASAGNADYIRVMTYDHWGNVLTETTSDNGTTRYLYDKVKRVRFMQDAKGSTSGSLAVSYIIYDQLGRITEEGYLPGAEWNETTLNSYLSSSPYSASGYPSGRIWRKRYYYGTNTSSLYDWNRLLTVEVNNNTDVSAEVVETFSYDSDGNVARKGVKAAGESEFTYIDYEYNNQGLVTLTNYNVSGFNPVDNTYDIAGRLAKVSSGATSYALYSYNKNGALASENLNNNTISRTYQYNSAGRLTQLDDPYFSESLSYTSGGAGGAGYYSGLIAGTGITYKSGSWISPPSSYTVGYKYDRYGRLLTADNSINSYDLGVGDTIKYDANGNILFFNQNNTPKTYTYFSGKNRLKNITGNEQQQFDYDANGNVIRSDPKQISSILYDPYFNLTSQISTANSVTSFQYGAGDQRVLKSNVAGGITRNTYYIHGANDYPLIEKGQETKIYIYGLNGMIGIRQNNQTEYLLQDHLGSTRVVVANSGTVLAHYDYQAYGSLMRSTNPNQVNYEYTGQEQDDETGLQNYRARMYDSDLGIFYAIDPEAQFPSPYSYTNNPISYTDPDGNWFGIDDGIAAVLGGTINLVSNAVQGNVKGFGSALSYFGVGALSGEATLYGGPLAGAAVLGLGNNLTAQVSANGWQHINPGQLAASMVMSVGTSWAGGQLSGVLSPYTTSLTSQIASPLAREALTQGITNSASGFALGAGTSLLSGNGLADALGDGLSGASSGFGMGLVTGGIAGYQYAKQNHLGIWSGRSTLAPIKPLESVGVEFAFTNTAGRHMDEIITRGENKGQLSRPYMRSPLTVKEIMSTGKGVRDATYKGGRNWRLPGTFRDSKGTWELGINPKTKIIYHFNFISDPKK